MMHAVVVLLKKKIRN